MLPRDLKRYRPILTIAITAWTLLATGTGAQTLPLHDSAQEVPVASAFTYLKQHGIVRGFPDGTAQLAAPLTRVEGLKAILSSREKYAPQVVWFGRNLPELSLFSDTDQREWYAPYLEVAFLEGIVSGYSDSTFHPGQPLSGAEALTLLHRAYGTAEASPYHTTETVRNRPGEWYTDAVSSALERNLIREGMFLDLHAPITRGQFFEVLHRIHTTAERGEYAFSSPSSTSSNSYSLQPLPLRVTPQPFRASDPFILHLPVRVTTQQPADPAVIPYASEQPFAITIPNLEIFDIAIAHPLDPFSEKGILEPLRSGLGHLFSYPGTGGKAMIYGHSSSWPWDVSEFAKIFRRINQLSPGDRVYITYDGALHVYEVSRKQVLPANDISAFDDDGTEELILYTCWPPDSTDKRYFVHAVPVQRVALR